MVCEEVMVDLRIPDPKSFEEGKRLTQLAFRLNHTMPMTDEYQQILKELFGDNNHDPYERMVLPCKPILIKKGAWIGAGSTILPGICIGEHAIVGAASVVTKDVPDCAVVVGNPEKVVKMLEVEKFS